MEKQNNGVITDKNFKSNKIEPISNMAIDIMNTGLPLELAGAVATDLYEQGYRKVTEDVVPRNEVEKFIQEIDQIQKDKAEVTYLKEQLIKKAKQEFAKQIFDLIDNYIYIVKTTVSFDLEFLITSITELKKKYIGE